jgi:hypothetical protein
MPNRNIWGSFGWRFLHSMSYHLKYGSDEIYRKYPLEKLKIFLNKFLISFAYLLPCDKCSKNFLSKLENIYISHDENKKIDIINFILNVHNEKSNRIWSRKELDNEYYSNNTLNEFNYENIRWIKIVYDYLPLNFDGSIREAIYNFYTLLFMFYPSKDIRKIIYDFTNKYNLVAYLSLKRNLYNYFIELYDTTLNEYMIQDKMYKLEYSLYYKNKKTERNLLYFKYNIEEYVIDKKIVGDKIFLYISYIENNIYKKECIKENIDKDCEIVITPLKFLYNL